MTVSKEQFERLVSEAIDSLPDDILQKLNNVAFFVEDYPTKEQLRKTGTNKQFTLFGLYEGYYQGKKLGLNAVLPDRITIFRKPILQHCATDAQIKAQICSTIKHEIAHHFGSDEKGARMAAKTK
jgi:predicted Zn-dependent protease with MMP-like domain